MIQQSQPNLQLYRNIKHVEAHHFDDDVYAAYVYFSKEVMCLYLDYWKKIKTELEILSCNVFFRPVDFTRRIFDYIYLRLIYLCKSLFPQWLLHPNHTLKQWLQFPHHIFPLLSVEVWKLHTGLERSKVEKELIN